MLRPDQPAEHAVLFQQELDLPRIKPLPALCYNSTSHTTWFAEEVTQLQLQLLFVYRLERLHSGAPKPLKNPQLRLPTPISALREHNTENTVWQYRGQK